jgi:2TM domain
MSHAIHDSPTDHSPDAPADGDQLARQQAIRQIERRRRFWISTTWSAIAMLILVAIWATSEYHNAGGWPVNGFSQSSGIHEVWNFWIVYPLGAWLLAVAAHAWFVYGNKAISESEIKREIERQAGSRHGR